MAAASKILPGRRADAGTNAGHTPLMISPFPAFASAGGNLFLSGEPVICRP
jgi:hypothetical protein